MMKKYYYHKPHHLTLKSRLRLKYYRLLLETSNFFDKFRNKHDSISKSRQGSNASINDRKKPIFEKESHNSKVKRKRVKVNDKVNVSNYSKGTNTEEPKTASLQLQLQNKLKSILTFLKRPNQPHEEKQLPPRKKFSELYNRPRPSLSPALSSVPRVIPSVESTSRHRESEHTKWRKSRETKLRNLISSCHKIDDQQQTGQLSPENKSDLSLASHPQHFNSSFQVICKKSVEDNVECIQCGDSESKRDENEKTEMRRKRSSRTRTRKSSSETEEDNMMPLKDGFATTGRIDAQGEGEHCGHSSSNQIKLGSPENVSQLHPGSGDDYEEELVAQHSDETLQRYACSKLRIRHETSLPQEPLWTAKTVETKTTEIVQWKEKSPSHTHHLPLLPSDNNSPDEEEHEDVQQDNEAENEAEKLLQAEKEKIKARNENWKRLKVKKAKAKKMFKETLFGLKKNIVALTHRRRDPSVYRGAPDPRNLKLAFQIQPLADKLSPQDYQNPYHLRYTEYPLRYRSFREAEEPQEDPISGRKIKAKQDEENTKLSKLFNALNRPRSRPGQDQQPQVDQYQQTIYTVPRQPPSGNRTHMNFAPSYAAYLGCYSREKYNISAVEIPPPRIPNPVIIDEIDEDGIFQEDDLVYKPQTSLTSRFTPFLRKYPGLSKPYPVL